MLLLLYFLPLLFKVWQRSGSYCCYIFYHYCFRFYRGVVHVVVVILSTITVKGMREEWFMLLLYCLPLLFKVWKRNASCCWWLYCLPLLLKIWQKSGSCCCCYIVYHYCLRFDRGSFKLLWFLYCLSLLFKVWQRSGSWC